MKITMRPPPAPDPCETMKLDGCSTARSSPVAAPSSSLNVPYPLHLLEGEPKSLLTQFAGEPQVVNVSSISHFTESLSWDPGSSPAVATQYNPSVQPSTITINGTYCTPITS